MTDARDVETVELAPKRRGRPKGSKNAPKIPAISYPIGPGVAEVPRAEIETWTLSNPGVDVIVRFKAAFSSPLIEVPATWRHGWPMPQLNDVVRVGGHAGRVQYVEFDHDRGVIIITAS